MERRQAEAELQHQRQDEGQGADRDPEEEPAIDPGAEGRDGEQAQIDDRMRVAIGVAHIGRRGRARRSPAAR